MSHYFDSGFSVREPAWHGLATVLEEYPGSWAEARSLAGLDWEPQLVPSYRFDGVTVEGARTHDATAAVAGDYVNDDGFNRVIRSDTGATLAHAKDTYKLITHADMGGIIEAVLDQPHVKYETAGVLEGGRAVWCLAYLDEPITLPGDDSLTLPYLTILNRHDGFAACRLQATAVRVVCANTFKAAELEGNRSGAFYSFRHTAGWKDRIADARDAITGARTEMARYVEMATDLLKVVITAEQTERFIAEFIPAPPESLISDRVARNIDTARQTVRSILASQTTVQVAHTGYGLVQAAGEYLDHLRSYRSADTYLNRTLLRPEPLKHKALALVREITNG